MSHSYSFVTSLLLGVVAFVINFLFKQHKDLLLDSMFTGVQTRPTNKPCISLIFTFIPFRWVNLAKYFRTYSLCLRVFKSASQGALGMRSQDLERMSSP